MNSEKSFLEFFIFGENHIDQKFTNLTLYGKIGEKNFIKISSSEVNFFDQITKNRENINFMPYEFFETKNLSYFLQLEYIIENCSKWEYFTNRTFEDKEKQ